MNGETVTMDSLRKEGVSPPFLKDTAPGTDAGGRVHKIPVAGPWITAKEINYVADAAANAWYGQANAYNVRFEQALAGYLGVSFAVSLPSCTSAIHLALLALGIGPGDEVVVPDITWIATTAPISYVGATPVFADIDPHTWCLSAESFKRCLTPRTRAVIPVDLYGGVPDWRAIREIAAEHGISIIEDAAEALGSEYRGKKAGGFGEVGVFSFHGSKTLTTGEGGMLVTNRQDLYDRVLVLRDHGRRQGGKMFWNTEVAFKYKMSSLQAALGLAQLERIEELVQRKRLIFSWYKRALAKREEVTLNWESPDILNTFWMVTAILDKKFAIRKEKLIKKLGDYRIDSRPFFYPLSSLPAYRKLKQARQAKFHNQVSYSLSPFGINLPSGYHVTEEDVDYICKCLWKILSF